MNPGLKPWSLSEARQARRRRPATAKCSAVGPAAGPSPANARDLNEVQAWNLVARLIVALEGTEHLSDDQAAALAGLFRSGSGVGQGHERP